MAINPELLRLYKQGKHCGPANSATYRLAAARKLLAEGKKAYSDEWSWQRGAHNVTIQPKRPFDSSQYAWIENTCAAGLRFVGYADEIAGRPTWPCRGIDHQGWFIDSDFQSEVYRGGVWQLPARKGVARYLAGYSDPHNDGAAFVDLNIIEGERQTDSYDSRDEDAKRDAAFRADSIAERNAEREREYNDVWQKGAEYESLGEDVESERSALIELLSESRELRKDAKLKGKPALCALLRSQVTSALRTIEKAREKRAKLLDEYGSYEAFKEHLPQTSKEESSQ